MVWFSQGVELKDLRDHVTNGKIMEKPPNCDQKLYSIMKTCWAYEPKNRPNFRKLTKIFMKNLVKLGGNEAFLEEFKTKSFYFSKSQ
jgi:hypothetical protein